MCYIIFIKCKINQHINTRDTVCFYRTFTMGVTCGIFFIVSTTQKQTGGNLTWVFSLTEIQRSASWSASSVKNSISSSCRSLMSKCSSPSSLSEIAAISTHTHTHKFLNSGRHVVWQDRRKLRTAQHASVRSIETRVLVDLRNRA